MAKNKHSLVKALVFLTLLYFATRLVNLTLLPIFTDEAIYIRWGQIGLRDAAHRFLSLEDGKQPLFIWLMYPLLKVFSDPLVAGRLVSVLSGFLNLTGIFLLTKKLFNQKAALIASLLYIFSPFFLFYDRLAIYDSLTTSFAIWALLFQVVLVQSFRLDAALLLGLTVGAGLLTKSSAQFSLYLLPFSLILFDWKAKQKLPKLLKWFSLVVLVTIFATAISWAIKLSPLAHMVGQKNLTFILSFSDFFADPFSRLIGNLRGLSNWFVGYFGITWIILLVIGTYMLFKSNWKKILLLFSWFILPFVALAAFAIVLYPRFILFMTFPLLVLLAASVDKIITQNKKFTPWTIAALIIPLHISANLLINPIYAKIPNADRLQFIDDWPAGYGINEVVQFARIESQKEPIFIATEGTFGLTPYALTIYLQGTPNLEVKGYWPISDGIEEITEIAKQKTTYILFKDTQEPKPEWPLQFVAQYRKGKSDVFMKLYKVNN